MPRWLRWPSRAFKKAQATPALPDHLERDKQFDQAEAWYRKLIEIDSNDKTAYYSLGVIAWERFYPQLMLARAKLNMRPQDPGPLRDFNTRADLRGRFGRTVEDGIASLKTAQTIDPLYDDAMAYLNLLYRERADLDENAEDYKRDIEIADGWVGKALDARKRKGESANLYPAAPPPPPPPPPSSASSGRIRVAGDIQAANLIQKTDPSYPPLARQARVQGTVRFSVIVGKDGMVQNVQLISGHPLLIPSAVDTVKQYVYRTTLLNGQPVEVITQVDVNFTLTN